MNVLLLEGIHPTAVKNIQDSGLKVQVQSGALSEAALIEQLKDVHLLGIRSRSQLTESIFQAASNLMAVGCFCIGTNQVDLNAAQQRGIPVFNAPFSNTRSVAELVLAEAIMLIRGVPLANALAHKGVWKKSAKESHEARGKKLGIIGYGNIGSQLSVLAESLGMSVYFYDTAAKLPLGNAVSLPSLEALLNTCDIVSLHVPDTPDTVRMINANTLAMMQPKSILINASRGTVIDIDALTQALSSGHLSGAAIDVFPEEPSSNEEPFHTPLSEFDNVILTPHVGGSTQEAQENIGWEVSKKMIKYFNNGTTTTSVNFPEVTLPSYEGRQRFLHIHQNVPGVLSEINRVFSDNKMNISAQYLQTQDKLGYVVTDIDSSVPEALFEKLSGIEGTIKIRQLT